MESRVSIYQCTRIGKRYRNSLDCAPNLTASPSLSSVSEFFVTFCPFTSVPWRETSVIKQRLLDFCCNAVTEFYEKWFFFGCPFGVRERTNLTEISAWFRLIVWSLRQMWQSIPRQCEILQYNTAIETFSAYLVDLARQKPHGLDFDYRVRIFEPNQTSQRSYHRP